jgi:hypothetical protein
MTLHNLKYLLFTDDLMTYHSVNHVNYSKHLQSDIISVDSWYLENRMVLKTGMLRLRFITMHHVLHLFKDLGVPLDCKLCFNYHIHCALSQCLKMLSSFRYISYSIDGL